MDHGARRNGVHRPALRVLHCADFHFDLELRHDALAVVRKLADLRRCLGAEVVLVAGDIFDSNRQPADFVEEVAEGLRALRVPLVAIPGNHDVVYGRGDPATLLFSLLGGQAVYLSSARGHSVVTADGRLRVWGRGMPEHSPSNDPLSDLEVMPDDALWNVALAHGELESTRAGYPLSSATDLGDHAAALHRIDYLALGHHHYPAETAYGLTIVRYSGSPSRTVGTGEVTLIEFSHEDGPLVSSHSVGG